MRVWRCRVETSRRPISRVLGVEVLANNEGFCMQITELSAQVEVLTSDPRDNNVTREGDCNDRAGVNELAVKLGTKKTNLELASSGLAEAQASRDNLGKKLSKLRSEQTPKS